MGALALLNLGACGANYGIAQISGVEKAAGAEASDGELSVQSTGVDLIASKEIGGITLYADAAYIRQQASVSRENSIAKLDLHEVTKLAVGASYAYEFDSIHVAAFLGGASYSGIFEEFVESSQWAIGGTQLEVGIEISIPYINGDDSWASMGPLFRLSASQQTYTTPDQREYPTRGLWGTLAWMFYLDEGL